MSSASFRNLAKHLGKGSINFDTGTFKALLVNAVPSETQLDTLEFRDELVTDGLEVTGTGYTAGGFVCTPASGGVLNTTLDQFEITFANGAPAFGPSASITARGAVIYHSTGLDTTDELVSFVDFGTNITSVSGDFNVTFSDSLNISVA